jgi:L-ribulose-5-phosphate 3-epimerase UlaE
MSRRWQGWSRACRSRITCRQTTSLSPPGTGKVDFPALFAELRRGGLEGGPLMIEMVKPGDLAQTLEEIKKAKRFMEQLVGAA